MEQWRENLAALSPWYAPDGANSTRIYTTAGALILDRRTVRWNLRRLARSYCLDLEALRRDCGRYLGLSQGMPLPFSPSLILVPLKMRKPVGRHDGSYGYVNCLAAEKLIAAAGSGRCRLLLQGGHELECLYTEQTARKRLRSGKILQDRCQGELDRLLSSDAMNLRPDLPREWWILLESLVKAMLASREGDPGRD